MFHKFASVTIRLDSQHKPMAHVSKTLNKFKLEKYPSKNIKKASSHTLRKEVFFRGQLADCKHQQIEFALI